MSIFAVICRFKNSTAFLNFHKRTIYQIHLNLLTSILDIQTIRFNLKWNEVFISCSNDQITNTRNVLIMSERLTVSDVSKCLKTRSLKFEDIGK